MAAHANIAINDGQTTPVSHIFTPTVSGLLLPDRSVRYGWADYSVNGGVWLGANKVEMDVRMPAGKGQRMAKAGDASNQLATTFKFVLPTLESLSNNTASGINPQPTHAFDTTVWVKVVRNGRAGQQPVKDALAFMRNFSLLGVFTDVVLNYAPPSS